MRHLPFPRRVVLNSVITLLGVTVVSAAAVRAQSGASASREGARSRAIPHLRKQGTAMQLIVNGAPFLILGGELGNSSASNMEYMRTRWATLHALHLNTVIAPAYWELIEPIEGKFDFTSVDRLIVEARRNNLRIVLLWFGSWKNSMSTYPPAWVRTNQTRFPRTESTRGRSDEILAPFDSANWQADARAFHALMRHLRSFDATQQTVLMVQVENEIGMIPEARDHSARADARFAQPVPAELLAYMQRNRATLAPELRAMWDARGMRAQGTWEEVFGSSVYTDELFMSWYFARYTERVTAAGKSAYPLPMYANAALIRPGYLPGRYVSAGPLPHLIDVWRAASPSLDFISPDIYFPNFTEWADKYTRSGNPLFIPEANLAGQPATNAWYAIGAGDAFGFSPFAIESVDAPAAHPVAASYELLAQLSPLLLANQGKGTMTAVIPTVAFDGAVDASPQRVSVQGAPFALTVTFLSAARAATPSVGGASAPGGVPVAAADMGRDPRALGNGAIIIALSSDEFLIAGSGVTITFEPTSAGDPIAGILQADAGRFVNGKWMSTLRLNGDQTHQGRHVRIDVGAIQTQRVKLYRYR